MIGMPGPTGEIDGKIKPRRMSRISRDMIGAEDLGENGTWFDEAGDGPHGPPRTFLKGGPLTASGIGRG